MSVRVCVCMRVRAYESGEQISHNMIKATNLNAVAGNTAEMQIDESKGHEQN